jgi:hypothetical protein
MNRLLIAGALGAMTMYFLDPQQGRRRRARTRDKALHAGKVLAEAGKVTARDTRHRAIGMIASAERLLRRQPEETTDEVLVDRVRAALGRAVSHSHAIRAEVHDGHVLFPDPSSPTRCARC